MCTEIIFIQILFLMLLRLGFLMFIREKKKEVRILDSLCTTDYSTELMSGESQTFVTPQNNLQKSYCFGIWSTAFGSQDYSTYLFISLSNWNG